MLVTGSPCWSQLGRVFPPPGRHPRLLLLGLASVDVGRRHKNRGAAVLVVMCCFISSGAYDGFMAEVRPPPASPDCESAFQGFPMILPRSLGLCTPHHATRHGAYQSYYGILPSCGDSSALQTNQHVGNLCPRPNTAMLGDGSEWPAIPHRLCQGQYAMCPLRRPDCTCVVNKSFHNPGMMSRMRCLGETMTPHDMGVGARIRLAGGLPCRCRGGVETVMWIDIVLWLWCNDTLSRQ